MHLKTARAFTLIELLVVVLIIGVLAAVALPQYQKAVMKSRFASLKPIAKAVKDAQEFYFEEHGYYAEEDELPGLVIDIPEGVDVELSETDGHDYVRVNHDKLNNSYTMYLAHSENFANNVYCEALATDNAAKSLCVAEGAQADPVTAGEYLLYLLSGNSTGTVGGGSSQNSGERTQLRCDYFDGGGETCYYSNGDVVSRGVCEEYDGDDCVSWTASESHYENGQFTSGYECQVSNGTPHNCAIILAGPQGGESLSDNIACGGEGEVDCQSYQDVKLEVNEEEDGEGGRIVSLRVCESYSGNVCAQYNDYNEEHFYDPSGNMTAMRRCANYEGQTCTEYEYGEEYSYDSDRNMTVYQSCTSYDGQTCTQYSYGVETSYDENGDPIGARSCYEYDGTECLEWIDMW
ncbi:MAG: prepilin-type N-terminal cleavage/methylation domain-containing protein [Elusimicrobiaceae bacterium]|nr:prepilin-type N-terminal cleavage/methylation domain-containing protein [Elusimicrobiaceae bacterium]